MRTAIVYISPGDNGVGPGSYTQALYVPIIKVVWAGTWLIFSKVSMGTERSRIPAWDQST